MTDKNVRTVLEKGFYNHPQKSGEVQLKQYVIVKEKGKRCLLLRFLNESDILINGLNIILTETRSHGKEPKITRIRLGNLTAYPGQTCVPKNGIVLSEDCTDFTVEITSIISRGYEYLDRGGKWVPRYNPRLNTPPTRKGNGKITVKKRRMAKSGLSAVVAIAGIIGFLVLGIYLADMIFGDFVSPLLSLAAKR